MNDERFLKDWLRDTTSDTPDPQASADRVLAKVPEIRQRSRWWPWLPGRRRPNDDTPSNLKGRTRLMLSPAKAVIAGALVFGLSTAFLLARPFDQGGSVPGAEPGAEPLAPVEVTGTLTWSEDACTETPERVGPVEWNIGATCEVDMEWSDPRLQGTGVQIHNGMSYSFGDDIQLDIDDNVLVIVTDDGAWRMRPHVRFHFPDMSGPGASPEWYVLDGEDDYEGLSVILVAIRGGTDLRGFIIESELLPPPPEGASTK